jgi:tetratricopeptide (TPR) repeat protein
LQGIITIFEPHRWTSIMLRNLTRALLPAFILLIWTGMARLNGQQPAGNIRQIRDSAQENFDRGDFRAALAKYRSLTGLENNNILYKYYAGRCLVELNEELDEAIELLYGPSRNNGPQDAIFYLGKAYMRSYDFQEAINCFEKYDMTASRQDRKMLDVKRLIETCRSAIEITSEYNPFEVMNVTFMDLSDSAQFSQVKMKGGELTRKPGSYFQEDEDPGGLTSLMFKPKNAVRGDYIYFAGYERNRKNGAQIYRIRKSQGKFWSDPEEVAALNSQGNEILPYFDPIEKDIYFASDGRSGVGGFDLYKSHYDTERDQWSDPVNLGFPVNSVMDEYLLLPGTDLGMVLFFTNRNRTDSTVAVYRLHLTEPKKKTANNDPQALLKIARLGDKADEFLADIEEAGRVKRVPGSEGAASGVASAVPPPEVKEELPVSAYQLTLSLALQHQVTSDSLKDLAASARIKVRESKDPNDRWVWQKQIMVWEKKARDEEELADQLYSKMDMERTDLSAGYAVNPPETIEVDRVIGDLTVYRYKGSGPSIKSVNKSIVPAATNNFDILSQSPYDGSHPIPMDIDLPSGIFYRIQLGAYGQPIDPDHFGGISPITGEHLKQRGLIKYYAGKFSRYEDASSVLPRIHTLGFEDAFIVAWYNGNPVPTQKAKQLE